MDQKLEILNYINDERLDLEELAETEGTLYETIAALPDRGLSTVIENYLSAVERTEDLLQQLDELEDKVINCPWFVILTTASLGVTTLKKSFDQLNHSCSWNFALMFGRFACKCSQTPAVISNFSFSLLHSKAMVTLRKKEIDLAHL